MEVLKLTSIRLSKAALDAASKLGRDLGYYRTSDVLRVAIWLGLKFIRPGVLHELLHMMWVEETEHKSFTLEHVLRTAGVIKDVEHSEGV